MDITPKQFLNTRRLHAFRRVLQTDNGLNRVADVAEQFEFWHMGKLANDYRALFGELPSKTLQVRRQRTAAVDPQSAAQATQ